MWPVKLFWKFNVVKFNAEDFRGTRAVAVIACTWPIGLNQKFREWGEEEEEEEEEGRVYQEDHVDVTSLLYLLNAE